MNSRLRLTPARLAAALAVVVGITTLTAAATSQALSGGASQPLGSAVVSTAAAHQATHIIPNQTSMYPGDEKRSANGLYQFIFQNDGNLVIYRTDNQAVIWSANTDGKGGVKLYMQAAGNFQLSNRGGATVWGTQTTATDGTGMQTYGRIEDDGRLRLHRDNGPIWSTPADPNAPAPVPTSSRPTSSRPVPTSSRPVPTSSRPIPTPSTSRPIPSNDRPTPTASKTDTMVALNKILKGNGLYSRNDKYVFGLFNNGDLALMKTDTQDVLWRLNKADQGGHSLTLLADGNLSLRTQDGREIWNSNTRNIGSLAPRFVMQNDGNAVLYHGDTAVWATNTDQP